MAVLIDRETIEYAKSSIDFDRFGDRFKTENGLFSFPDPNIDTIERNLFFLLKNATEIAWESKYKYRPD